MSAPAWSSRVLTAGYDAAVWIQDAAVTAAPGDSDMVAFGTTLEISIEREVETSDPFFRLGTRKKTNGGKTVSGSISYRHAKGTDAVRAKIINAANSDTDTRLKITAETHASGEKFVIDQAIPSVTIGVESGTGGTGDVSFEADDCDYSAASA